MKSVEAFWVVWAPRSKQMLLNSVASPTIIPINPSMLIPVGHLRCQFGLYIKTLIACAERLPSRVTQETLVDVAERAHEGQKTLYFRHKTLGDNRFKDFKYFKTFVRAPTILFMAI